MVQFEYFTELAFRSIEKSNIGFMRRHTCPSVDVDFFINFYFILIKSNQFNLSINSGFINLKGNTILKRINGQFKLCIITEDDLTLCKYGYRDTQTIWYPHWKRWLNKILDFELSFTFACLSNLHAVRILLAYQIYNQW